MESSESVQPTAVPRTQVEGQTLAAPVVPEGGPRKPLSLAQTIWYSLANLGYGMFFSFNNAVLPLFLQRYTNNAVLLGLLGSSHSVEGAIIQPLVGSYSDRLRSRWGRRRPLILLFMPLSAVFLMLTPLAAHLPDGVRLGVVVASIFLFTVAFNVGFDPYQALMPDITPVSQRGRVTSLWTLLGVLGQAGILLLPLPLEQKFAIVGGVMLVTTLLTCAFTREPDTGDLPAVHKSHWDEMKEALRGLATLRQARKGLAVFFLSGAGVGAVLPFLTLFVKKITNCTDHEAEMMFLVLMVSTAVTVIPCGWLTDRFGAKPVLICSLLLIAGAAINGLWVTTLSQISVVLAIAGIGSAMQSAASYPLMTQLVPADEVGFYTGLQTMALSIAQPATVFITGLMIAHGSYRIIFAVCSACMILALFVLLTINQKTAHHEIIARDREMGREIPPHALERLEAQT